MTGYQQQLNSDVFSAPLSLFLKVSPLYNHLLRLSHPQSIGSSFMMMPRATAPSTASLAHLSSRGLRSQAVRSFATIQEGVPPAQQHGGLKDYDRIFTNLYDHHGADIKAAMKYGDWYRTKDIVLKGHEWVGDFIYLHLLSIFNPLEGREKKKCLNDLENDSDFLFWFSSSLKLKLPVFVVEVVLDFRRG